MYGANKNNKFQNSYNSLWFLAAEWHKRFDTQFGFECRGKRSNPGVHCVMSALWPQQVSHATASPHSNDVRDGRSLFGKPLPPLQLFKPVACRQSELEHTSDRTRRTYYLRPRRQVKQFVSDSVWTELNSSWRPQQLCYWSLSCPHTVPQVSAFYSVKVLQFPARWLSFIDVKNEITKTRINEKI